MRWRAVCGLWPVQHWSIRPGAGPGPSPLGLLPVFLATRIPFGMVTHNAHHPIHLAKGLLRCGAGYRLSAGGSFDAQLVNAAQKPAGMRCFRLARGPEWPSSKCVYRETDPIDGVGYWRPAGAIQKSACKSTASPRSLRGPPRPSSC
jgi:hypothetical protein